MAVSRLQGCFKANIGSKHTRLFQGKHWFEAYYTSRSRSRSTTSRSSNYTKSLLQQQLRQHQHPIDVEVPAADTSRGE